MKTLLIIGGVILTIISLSYFGLWITLGIAVGILIIISVLAALGITKAKEMSKEDNLVTELAPETGKLVKQGENIVAVLSNFKDGHYTNDGKWELGAPPGNGELFTELGFIYFGLTPIQEIFVFPVSWSRYIEKEAQSVQDESESRKPKYELVEQSETVNYFKRFYTHAIEILRIEMAGGVKIDMVVTVTFELSHVIQVIYKIKPDGIILAQGETGFAAAMQDALKGKDYEEFRDKTDKSNPESEFVKDVLERTNAITDKNLYLNAVLMEVNYIDLSLGEPGDEEMEKAMKAKEIAGLTGDAKVVTAKKNKEAAIVDGEADAAYFESVKKVIGEKNIGEFANLRQAQKTELRVYNGASNTLVAVDGDTKKKED